MRRGSAATSLGLRLAAGAIFVAPFIALLYRAEAGLIVMALAIAATSFLLHGAIDAAPAHARRRLRLVLGVNALLMVACVALAVWLVARN